MKLAVVGVTGMVGKVMCEVLAERNFPISAFLPVASAKSVGQEITAFGKNWEVIGIEEAIAAKPDIAIFSAGSKASIQWAPTFAEAGTVVIDNSSAWRMSPNHKLVVPEINGHVLTQEDLIIANPNCSTIQMVMALNPLHRAFKIKRLVISTYQSMTGTGVQAVKQYEEELQGQHALNPAYPHPIFENCLPHCDVFLENGYTKEEMKMVEETHKILGDDSIRITATAVRVPVKGGHSESINIEFEYPFALGDVLETLENTPGVLVQDDPKRNLYPMPRAAAGRNEVFVGRIRRDHSVANGLNLWVVSDNLRKGAATNAVQIAEHCLAHNLLAVS